MFARSAHSSRASSLGHLRLPANVLKLNGSERTQWRLQRYLPSVETACILK